MKGVAAGVGAGVVTVAILSVLAPNGTVDEPSRFDSAVAGAPRAAPMEPAQAGGQEKVSGPTDLAPGTERSLAAEAERILADVAAEKAPGRTDAAGAPVVRLPDSAEDAVAAGLTLDSSGSAGAMATVAEPPPSAATTRAPAVLATGPAQGGTPAAESSPLGLPDKAGMQEPREAAAAPGISLPTGDLPPEASSPAFPPVVADEALSTEISPEVGSVPEPLPSRSEPSPLGSGDPVGLAAAPAGEMVAATGTNPALVRPPTGTPNQPVQSRPSETAAEAPTAYDPGPPSPVEAAALPAPAQDDLDLAQGAEPVGSALPRLIELEGRAMPGNDAVRVRRPEPAPTSAAPPAAAAEVVPEDAPARLRFAAPFVPPEPPRPLLSLVILDDGTMADAPALLADLPVPVSVALDPSAPDATARMEAFRAAGIEVLALGRLPARPQPQDVEVFLGPALGVLSEAVAVLDLGEGGLRTRDATARMALSRLAREGLGAVLVGGGLGRGAEAAEAAGVPAAEILRDLDGEGQDQTAILRQLDDAVRRAGQEGQAVLLARLRPETLQVLSAWTQGGRVNEVAVAPVSAVLRR